MAKDLNTESKALILTGVILAMLLASLDQTIVSTALPQIVKELNGLEHLSWVFTSYMLASTISVPIYGKLSDLYGRRGLYMLGIIIFLLGSALSGQAHSMLELILFRGLQGIGAGAIMVNSIALIGDLFPPAERSRYQGMIMAIFGLASVVGPLLGGWITDHASWRWVFYVNVPVGTLAIAVLTAALPKIKPDTSKISIDFLGALLLTTTLVPALLALVWGGTQYPWHSWQIWSLFGVSIISLVSFIFAELHAKEPILSMELFKTRILNVSVIATFLSSMGMFGTILYIPVFAQGVTGISATNSGLVLTPMMGGLVVASIVSGQLISKTGRYKVLAIIGMALTVIAALLFSHIGISTTRSMLSWYMVLLGLGLGSTMPIFTIAVQSAFPHNKIGEVTAATQLARNIGGTVGTAVLGSVMNNQLEHHLSNISSEPFIQSIRSLGGSNAFSNFDANTIQSLLVPSGQNAVRSMLDKLPEAIRGSINASFDHLLNTLKLGFSQSIDYVFLFSAVLLATTVIVLFFMPEIPLRKTNEPATPAH